MPAFVYADGQYHALAGNKIVKDGQLLTMKDSDKIIAGGAAYNLGVATSAPSDPDAPSPIEFHATTEPTGGNVHYITPDGAGTKDGSSWANAASGSMVHVILLQCASGDRVYFSEGEYTTDRVMAIPSGVNLYGGFRASDSYAWSGRNSFTNPTHFTMAAAAAFAYAVCTSSATGQLIDGFSLDGYEGTLTGNGRIDAQNLAVSSGNVSVSGNIDYAILSNLDSDVSFYVRMSNVSMIHCMGTNSIPSGLNRTIDTCFFKNCRSSFYATEFDTCVFSGCTSNAKTSFILGTMVTFLVSGSSFSDCRFKNCATEILNIGGSFSNCIFDVCNPCFPSNGGASDCICVNCFVRGINTELTDCIFANCRGSINNCTNCAIVNCSSNVENGTNLIIVNNSGDVADCTNATVINCIGEIEDSINCVAFNCSHALSGTMDHCAQSEYNAANAVTLGYDNTIARFVNTGFTPARGVQDVGDCPNPLTDPDGYAAYLALFGDWHPQADSFLVGAGVAVSGITADLDGVTRPDPPTIGAYEPYPVEE